jgi:uncharacterized protein YjdB
LPSFSPADYPITYVNSDESVVSVDENGVVTALAQGD